MSLNVNKEVEDVYYRYKMPKLIAKVEGKGNGIKTVIVNMSDIAKALYRKPSYSTKYFGIELGAQVTLDDKNDRYIVNGCHDANKLQDLLHCFIKKFVLCQSCGNPETSLIAKKSSLLYRCKACGYSDQIDAVHRLTQFIVKNPPETEAEGAPAVTNKTKIEMCKTDFDDTWLTDNCEAIENININDLPGMAQQSDQVLVFHDFVEELFNKREIINQKKKIAKKAEELHLEIPFIFVVMEVIFCNRDTVLPDIELYKGLFQYFTRQGQPKAQEYVLLGMEKIIVLLNIVSSSCHFLKALYDNDIVEEEAILKWYNKGPSEEVPHEMSLAIMKECSKMVEWLREADEESDDD